MMIWTKHLLSILPAVLPWRNGLLIFRWGRESTHDDTRAGRPKSATTDVQVEGIHRIAVNDRRVTLNSRNQCRDGSYCIDRNLGDEQTVS